MCNGRRAPSDFGRERNCAKLRVAHVALQLDVGGMEKLLVEFARHVDRQRMDLQFVCLGKRGIVADEIEACGWPVTALDEPDGLRPGLVVRLARLFWQRGVDIVHTHNTKPLIYAAPAARLAGVKRVIHTRHGQRFFAGRRENFAFRCAAAVTHRLVCVSHDAVRLSAREGISGRRVAMIWNGIDLSRFAYAGPVEDGPVVVVARLSPEKDVGTLLEAAALAVKQLPSFRLHIAGDGPCLQPLRQKNESLGLNRIVTFLGQCRDVPGLLAGASLFVLPSLTEGISLTLLEAMARGLPVVATRVGGNPEVVAHGKTGLLVATRSPVELADAMVKLLQAPEERRQLGLAGRHRVEKHFDARRMVAEYEALYRPAKISAAG
jgi:glycosyltransferase involved in cell wall biosynthesis